MKGKGQASYYVTAFFMAFFIQSLQMILVNNQKMDPCYYDVIMIYSRNASFATYPVLSFFLLARGKVCFSYNYVVRSKSVRNLWNELVAHVLLWSIELTAIICVSMVISGRLFTDSIYNWNKTGTIFNAFTGGQMTEAPGFGKIVLLFLGMTYMNVVIAGLIVYLGYWYTGYYWMGIILMMVYYLTPCFPGLDWGALNLNLQYQDFYLNTGVFKELLPRIEFMGIAGTVMYYLGLCQRKRDFYQ